MPGTKSGGLKARDTNKARYGQDFYVRLGRMPHRRVGGFGNDRELASRAGKIGGIKSRRTSKLKET